MPKYDKQFIVPAEYKEALPKYEATRDFADGAPEAVCNQTYIIPYASDLTSEAQAKGLLQNRIDRTTNINVCGPTIEEHLRLCSKEITVQGFEGDKQELILKDVTGYGDSAKQGLRKAAEMRLRDGCAGVLVENDPEPGEQTRSFQIFYEALNILELEYFHSGIDKGRVKRVVLRNANALGDDGKMHARAKCYYKESDSAGIVNVEVWEFESDNLANDELTYAVIETHEIRLPYVPFIPLGRGPADSLIRDIWPINKGILNTNSILQNINYHQGFKTTVFFNVGDEGLGQVAEYSAIAVDGLQADLKQIEPGDPVAVEKYRNFLIHWAKRIGMHQLRQLQDDFTKNTQSAESKSKDLAAFEDFCNDLCDELEQKLEEVYKLHLLYENENTGQDALDNVRVTISRDFNLTDTEYELQKDALLWTWAAEMPQEALQALKKQIIKKYVSEMKLIPGEQLTEEEERKELLELIDAVVIEIAKPQRPARTLSFRERLNGNAEPKQDSGTDGQRGAGDTDGNAKALR